MNASAVAPVDLDDGRVRAVIERIAPSVDGGRFAVKRVLGDRVEVEADCFADGHDVLACRVRWRRPGDAGWLEAPMAAIGNDRWRGGFVVDALGDWAYTVQAWVDPYLSWRHDFSRRVDPQDLRVAALTGAALIGEAAGRAPAGGADATLLRTWAADLGAAAHAGGDVEALRRLALDEALDAVARRHPDRRLARTHEPALRLAVERERARTSCWYELFPRSASDDPERHGTFADCEAWLPYVARMGFDVLYLPPIHPIGRTRRKGRNNTLDARPGDPGSPWAIGAAEGGHDAIHPELGTIEDLRRLMAAAARHGIEIAMDIAFQCSPDHPWLDEHPEWFRRRADGTIQYAENPPKKYQDIYPFDFETPHWRELWAALLGVLEYWAAQGVRIFRVDNPHTKAFPFWEWAIARLRAAHPDAIFLSEAFTRPAVMHRLAKLGFSQSYTYYTWRNTKRELTEYFGELTSARHRDYFRPNVWPNTPDILPEPLQYGGRATFQARVALAATLSGNYGIYGPAFELLEHRAQRPGSEEYLDSEKYQRRVWDLAREDSLADYVAVLNRARREVAALRGDAALRFLHVDNDALIAYARLAPDGSGVVVCVVNLDPNHVQSGWLELDLEALGIEPGRPFQMHDLVSESRFLWQGPRNYVSLDPRRTPAHVMQLRSRLRRESDFDYFL